MICDICQKDFKNEIALRVHKGRVHFKLIEYTCKKCGKIKSQSERKKLKVYCSTKCKYKDMKNRYSGEGNPAYKGGSIKKVCEYCSIDFEADRGNFRRYARFCSKSCFSKNMWKMGRKSYCVNGVKVRTDLHEKYAEFLTRFKLTWFYRPKIFPLNDNSYFKPDFYVTEWNLFVHIPKKITDLKETKIESFKKEYPFYDLKVIQAEELLKITED